ncbi:MAG TPA: ATP synthase subunit I [Blastocatellia bacterium]|nr:ATP synthase subunit I [Blastocatellia bacterium]
MQDSVDSAQDDFDHHAVDQRIWRRSLYIVAAATIISFVFLNLRVALGLTFGGALSLLNYRWLRASLRDIFEAAADKTPPGTQVKFIARWLIIAVAGWAAAKTGFVDAAAIIAGLFAPAIAILIEAGYTTIKSLGRTQRRS